MTKKEKSQQSKEPPKYIRVLKILSIFSLCLTMLLLGVVNGATYVVKTDIGQDILKKVSIALRPHTPTIMWLCFALLTMAKQKKTGFGTYITTLVVDSDLTTTEARLFAFMQLHVDYRTGVFDLKRKTTCAKLDINLTTYTRALRTLIEKELVSVKHRTRGGQQITSHIQPRMEGFKLRFPRYLISELRDTAFLVYVELLNRCGKESWSLSRRVLAKKFHCSALTISRAIRQLKERNLIDAVPDYDRQGINRFRALSLHERVARLKRQHSRTILFFYQMHKLVLERKRQRTAALKRRYAYSLFAAPLSSMHLLFPIPRCFISKERKNKSLPLAKSNSLMGLLRRKVMDRARSPMVEFSG